MRGVRERTFVEPGAAWGGGFYGEYWGAGWAGPAAYLQTDTFVKFETTLWNPSDGGQLVWSAITQTENPRSGRDFAHSLVEKIVPTMAREGLIPTATGPRVSSATP
jgi:hypothetical protein